MTEALEGLKQFILSDYNALVEELSEPDIPLVPVDERHLVIGEIDLDKYTASHAISIMPVSEEFETLSLGANEARLQLEVYIFVRKASPKVLFQQAQRYGQILKQAIYADETLGGVVEDTTVNRLEVFFGVEGDPSVQAVMLELTLIYEESTE